MFSGCKQLEYINLQLYDEVKSITNINYILQNVPENLVICINKNNHITELLAQIKQKSCPTIYCGDDWKAHQRQMENNTCLYDDMEPTEETTNIIYTSSYNKPEIEISNTYKTYIEKTNNLVNNEKTYINPTDVISTEKEEISTNLNLEKTDIKKYISTYTLYEPESEVFSYPTSNMVSSSEWNGKSSFLTEISTKESSEETDTSSNVSEKLESYNSIINTIGSSEKTDTSSNVSEKLESSNSIISTKESSEKTDIDSTLILNKIEITHELEKISIIEIKTTLISYLFENIESLNKIKIDYYENSNYTSGEINQLIYEQIVNNIIKNIDDIKGNGMVIEGKNNCYYQFTTLEDERSNNVDNNSSIKFSKIDLGECEDVL